MQRITATLARDVPNGARVAVEAHAARASVGERLHFVWDMIACDAPMASLKFVLDAARRPLSDRPGTDFDKIYGLPRFLRFEQQQPRMQVRVDLFEGVY